MDAQIKTKTSKVIVTSEEIMTAGGRQLSVRIFLKGEKLPIMGTMLKSNSTNRDITMWAKKAILRHGVTK
jgi:hypothetical protein